MREIIRYESKDGIIFEDKESCLQWEAALYFEELLECSFDEENETLSNQTLLEYIENKESTFRTNLNKVILGLKHRIANDSE